MMVFWIRTLGACFDISVEHADSIFRATEFGVGGYWTNITVPPPNNFNMYLIRI